MKFTILLIRICLLLAASLVLAVSGSRAQESGRTLVGASENSLERIKTEVYRHGIGEKSTIVIKMHNGTTRKGYIRQTGDSTFELTNSKTRATIAIDYSSVATVKKSGHPFAVRMALHLAKAAAFTTIVLGVALAKAGGFE